MLTKTSPTAYLSLAFILILLSLIFFILPAFRLFTSIALGLSYFIWGMAIHLKDKSLHLPIVLEYFGLSLLATIILIFLSLRA